MSPSAQYLPYANWTQLNYRTFIVLPIPAPNGSGIELQVLSLKRRLNLSRLSVVKIEGETAALAILSTPNRTEAAVREKTRRPAQQTAAAPNYLFHTRRVDS